MDSNEMITLLSQILDEKIGMVTAYAYAKSKGYSGTADDFANDMANIGVNISAIDTAIDTFNNETVPNAETAITTAGSSQVNAVNAAGQEQIQNVTAEGGRQVGLVEAAGSAQTEAVNSAGSTQVGNVNTAGSTQVSAVNAKGQEVINSIPQDYTALSDDVTDLKSALDSLDTSIKPQMTVGSLMSEEYTEEKMPYLYRVSGGGVEVGKVEADEIVGGTVAWNQLMVNGNFETTTSWTAVRGTFSVSGNVLTYTSTEIGGAGAQNRIAKSANLPANHIYMISAECSPAHATNLVIIARMGTTNIEKKVAVTTGWSRNALMYAPTAEVTAIYIGLTETTTNGYAIGDIDYYKNVQVFDLTQMFGTTIADHLYSLEQSSAGAGVAVFRKMFPNAYYPYSAGELKHVSGVSEKVTSGKNLLDLSTITTTTPSNWGVDITDGVLTVTHKTSYSTGTPNCTLNLPAGDYFITYSATKGSSISLYVDDVYSKVFHATSNTFTVEKGHVYTLRFSADTGTPNVIRNLIVGSGTTLKAYEPYKKHTYTLDSSLTLRGIPKLSNGQIYWDGDTYTADGVVTRKYGIVTLNGSESWQYYSVAQGNMFRYVVTGTPGKNNQTVITSRYRVVALNESRSEGTVSGASDFLDIIDNNYSTIADWKASLVSNPITVVYQLGTPTTETAEPYEAYQHVTKGGTEEYVSAGIVPVGHITKYYGDIGSKVDGLPSDFSAIIAPTEKAYKATRNYTVNELIIINNVLYKVTANIASGSNITPNTNVSQTTLSALIKALSA